MKSFIPKGDLIAFDTEGTGLKLWHGDTAFALSFCNERGEEGYTEWPVDPYTRVVCPPRDELEIFAEWCEDERVTKVMHNRPYDMRSIWLGHGIQMRGMTHDTMLEMHVINTLEETYALKPWCKKYCEIGDDDESELQRKVIACRRLAEKRGYMKHENVQADYWMPRHFDKKDRLCEKYGRQDALRTIVAHLFCQTILEENPNLMESYVFENEHMFSVVYQMENVGLGIDLKRNAEEIVNQRAAKEEHLAELRRIAGDDDFDPDKPAQLIDLLFNKMKIEVKSRTKTGRPQVSQESLADYKSDRRIQSLFQYRVAEKGLSSFFEKYERFAVPDTWTNIDGCSVIHPNIRQADKRTARFSCTDPNLQGIGDKNSSRSEYPIEARVPFGPRPGYKWFMFDYEQLEARIFAKFSNAPVLVDSLLKGIDMHGMAANKSWGGEDNPRAIVAAVEALELWNKTTKSELVLKAWKKYGLDKWHWSKRRKIADEIGRDWLKEFGWDIVKAEKSIGKKNSRSKGKTMLFTRMFGGGKKSFMKKLNCEEWEAKQYINDYDEVEPGIIGHVREMIQVVKDNGGFVDTSYGRRLWVASDELYKGASYRVQGTAADLIKRAMVTIAHFLENFGIDGHVLMQIHDELILEISNETDVKKLMVVLRMVKRIMESHGDIVGFPLPVSCKVADKTWAEVKELAI